MLTIFCATISITSIWILYKNVTLSALRILKKHHGAHCLCSDTVKRQTKEGMSRAKPKLSFWFGGQTSQELSCDKDGSDIHDTEVLFTCLFTGRPWSSE